MVKLKNLGQLFIAIGLAIATLFAFWDDAKHIFPSPTFARMFFMWGSLILIFSGLLCFIADAVLTSTPAQAFSGFTCYHANPKDLEHVHGLATDLIGTSVSSLEDIRKFHEIDSQFVFVVTKKQKTIFGRITVEPVGYFIVYRLTRSGEKALIDGRFNGACPDSSHLSKPQQTCPAIYIGAIAAKWSARGYTTGALEQNIASDMRYRKAKWIYTRPVTRDGIRLVAMNDFEPLNSQKDGIGNLYRRSKFSTKI
jgi:hypothetical protein